MLFTIVVIVIFAGLVTRKAWQIRRVSRIAVHPQVYEFSPNRLSARFQRFLGEVEPQLLEMGFHLFGGVRTIELRKSFIWTGATFFNQETGERVSVLSWGHPKELGLAIGWVTEFTDGQRVTTHWAPPAPTALATGRDSESFVAGTPIVVDVAAWHRRRVEQAIAQRESVGVFTPPGRILPVPGNESQWNRSGADQMAKQVAASLNWRVGLTGRAGRRYSEWLWAGRDLNEKQYREDLRCWQRRSPSPR